MSILQIASLSKFIIFDLIALESYEEFSIFITKLFESKEILKLGYSFNGDLTGLYKSYPQGGFRSVDNIIDLADLSSIVDPTIKTKMSLQKMTGIVLGNLLLYIYIYI